MYKQQLRTSSRFYFCDEKQPKRNFTKIDDIDSLLSKPESKSMLNPDQGFNQESNNNEKEETNQNKDPIEEKTGFNSQVNTLVDS
jgi:hypothetical protein